MYLASIYRLSKNTDSTHSYIAIAQLLPATPRSFIPFLRSNAYDNSEIESKEVAWVQSFVKPVLGLGCYVIIVMRSYSYILNGMKRFSMWYSRSRTIHMWSFSAQKVQNRNPNDFPHSFCLLSLVRELPGVTVKRKTNFNCPFHLSICSKKGT